MRARTTDGRRVKTDMATPAELAWFSSGLDNDRPYGKRNAFLGRTRLGSRRSDETSGRFDLL